jgi:hypothetical protein
MKAILMKPFDALADAKKHKLLGKTVEVMLLAVILAGLSIFFFYLELGTSYSLYSAILGAIVLFVGVLVASFVLQLVFNIFTKKNDFFLAFTPLAYSWLIVATGMLAASILVKIPTFIGPMLAYLVGLPAFAVGLAVYLRGLMLTYDTDLITVIVALAITMVSLASALSLVVAGDVVFFFRQLFSSSLIPTGELMTLGPF